MNPKYVYCKICDATDGFTSILNLGEIYPSNFVESQENLKKYPLHLIRCDRCGLVQLEEIVDLDLMYRQYWYKSSLNPSMVKELTNIRDSILKRIKLEKDTIIDIGCNDGTLLRLFEEVDNHLYTIGFEPALNLTDEAQNNCTLLISDYFSADEINGVQAKVITSIAMFYDLPDPNKFVEDIKRVLHINGMWVVQFQDLLGMLKSNAFDNICHEHLEYYSLTDLHNLFEKHGLTIFDVEYTPVNGGSLRAYVCHSHSSKFVTNPVVDFYLEIEKDIINNSLFEKFIKNVQKAKEDLLTLLHQIKKSGERVFVVGASTKGNTLLQYFGIDSNLIDLALEVNENKFGLNTIGTNIPIVSEARLTLEYPEYLLILPWHFNNFFNKKFANFLEQGGRIIYALPSVIVIRGENDK